MDQHEIVALTGALVLAALHVFGARIRPEIPVPRSRWLSFAGGVSVAYVFAHLLPELAEGQEALEEGGGDGPVLSFLEHHVYLLALLGIVVFYGVEKHSVAARRVRRERTGEDRTTDGAFVLSVANFALYNAIIGYLLLQEEFSDTGALVLFVLAIAVHFVINDVSLAQHHGDAYRRTGRWVLAGAVLVGWAIGWGAEISERAIAVPLGFIGGGVVLNVLKEELPEERDASFASFVLGAVAYAVLLQIA